MKWLDQVEDVYFSKNAETKIIEFRAIRKNKTAINMSRKVLTKKRDRKTLLDNEKKKNKL